MVVKVAEQGNMIQEVTVVAVHIVRNFANTTVVAEQVVILNPPGVA